MSASNSPIRPILSMAVDVRSDADREKFLQGLDNLVHEDDELAREPPQCHLRNGPHPALQGREPGHAFGEPGGDVAAMEGRVGKSGSFHNPIVSPAFCVTRILPLHGARVVAQGFRP